MEVDWTWAEAFQIGGMGFGLVFAVLIVLALVMWLTGFLLSKIGGGADTTDKKQESKKN